MNPIQNISWTIYMPKEPFFPPENMEVLIWNAQTLRFVNAYYDYRQRTYKDIEGKPFKGVGDWFAVRK